jgi:hypothetical protein
MFSETTLEALIVIEIVLLSINIALELKRKRRDGK